MKKIVSIIGLIALGGLLFGCDFQNRGNGGVTEELKVEDYFPIRENVRYVYQGDGNEYASYDTYTDYTLENKVQYRKNTGGTVIAEVVEVSGDEGVAKIYSRGEFYYREDFLRNESLMWGDRGLEEVLLKEPLKEEATWKLNDGRVRTITGTKVRVEVPQGNYDAIEVTTRSEEYEMVDYYAKGVGHIKSVFKAEGHEISSSLESIEEDVPLTQSVNFYYPNLDENKFYYKATDIEFRTNDITRKTLESAYKDESGLELTKYGIGAVFTEKTEINHMYLGKDGMVYLDLNRAFIDEMNAGAQYESMILQSIANTFGNYYGAERVYLTIDGGNYSSGHIELKDGEYLEVDYANTVEIE